MVVGVLALLGLIHAVHAQHCVLELPLFFLAVFLLVVDLAVDVGPCSGVRRVVKVAPDKLVSDLSLTVMLAIICLREWSLSVLCWPECK